MYTSAELQMLRNADPGVRIPGIDTPAGDPVAPASLKPLSSISTSPTAPVRYDAKDNEVLVTQAGVTLSGYNFGSATVNVEADNVSITDSLFTATNGTDTGYGYAGSVVAGHGATNTTVSDCTFSSGGAASPLGAFIISTGKVTITGNRLIDAPADAIDVSVGGGVISGNYFSGAGYSSTGLHPDAIWISNSTAPLVVSNNFIDESANPNSINPTNDCIRITAELGSVSNVTVKGNFLLGGETSVDAGNALEGGTCSAISVTGNYLGFAIAYAFLPGPHEGVTTSGDVVFDYTNPVYSSAAWAAYEKAGLPTKSLLVSTGGSTVNNTNPGPTTLYGSPGGRLFGAFSETNFVGGFGRQETFGGQGGNVFTYLSPADSTAADPDLVFSFDPAKDVVDLSHIDANLTAAGVQGFTFIGANAFTAAGAQVRVQLDPTHGDTIVQATLAGDTTPDLQIQIAGLVPLTAGNFALTPGQSQTDFANAAALSVSHVDSGSALECLYANVKGKAYSSYSAFFGQWFGTAGVDDLNLSATSNQIDIDQNGVKLTRAGAVESLAIGNGTFALASHANETIEAANGGAETFAFSSVYGKETIAGFAPSGTTADTLVLSKSDFSYLTATMSQSQDLAAVLSHAASGANGVTIADTRGDSVALVGVLASTLTTHPGAVKFV